MSPEVELTDLKAVREREREKRRLKKQRYRENDPERFRRLKAAARRRYKLRQQGRYAEAELVTGTPADSAEQERRRRERQLALRQEREAAQLEKKLERLREKERQLAEAMAEREQQKQEKVKRAEEAVALRKEERRERLSTAGIARSKAQHLLATKRGILDEKYERWLENHPVEAIAEVGRRLYRTAQAAVARGKKRGLSCEDDLPAFLQQNPKLACTSCGIAFDFSPALPEEKEKYRPRIPSLDRLDSSKGYTRKNVRIVCMRCNSIKGAATVAELRAVLNYMIREGLR